jgi:hypothetical protein
MSQDKTRTATLVSPAEAEVSIAAEIFMNLYSAFFRTDRTGKQAGVDHFINTFSTEFIKFSVNYLALMIIYR